MSIVIARPAARGASASADARTMSRASIDERRERRLHRRRRARRREDVADDAQQALGVALRDVEIRAQVIGQVGILDREIEVAEDRGERRAQFVRDGRDELVARAERVQLGGDVARDDDGSGVLPRRVGEPSRGDAERLPRTGLGAEPHDLTVERLTAQRPFDGKLIGRQPRESVVAVRGHLIALRAGIRGVVVVGADRLLQPAVRLVRDRDLPVGRDPDDTEVDRVEHLGDLLLLSASALEHAPQQLRLLGQQSPLRVGAARGQVTRRGDGDQHERHAARSRT